MDADREHDVAVANVAHKMRVAVWEVHANVGPGPRRTLPVPGRPDVTPDIVAFEKHTHRLAAIGAVETAATLAAGAAEWKLYQMLAPRFFIYVPQESLDEALRLCRRHTIPYTAVRVYYYNARNQFVVAQGWRVLKRRSDGSTA